MKIRVHPIALLFSAVCLVSTSSIVAEGLFPDKVLEGVVRHEVFEKRNSKEPLTEKDVENISTIRYKGYTFTLDGEKVQRDKIKSLAGLETLRSLAELDLEANEIEDVSTIKRLTKIQSLNLAKNNIKDISPVANLTKLQYLKLDNNRISDVKALAKLENMRALYLENNKVTDIAAIGALKKINSLYLDGNQVKDIMPIAALGNLSLLGLRDCGLTDISSLSGFTELSFLFLENNKVTDISVLVEMAKKDREAEMRFAPFWKVYLNGNPLSDDAKTKQLEQLKEYSLESRIHFK